MSQEDKDLQRIKELTELMRENDLAEIEIRHGEDRIHLKRSQPQQPVIAALPMAGAGLSSAYAEPSPAAASPQKENLVEIKSPIVGTFYATPSPDLPAFVEVGSHIDPQTVVCIIEAMKVMNEIKAEISGTITHVLATNGQAVEYGQVLFKVRPA